MCETWFDRVEKRRKELGRTKRATAKAAGVAEGSYAQWATNTPPDGPKAMVAVQLARYLGVSCEWLLTGHDPQKDAFPLDAKKQIIQEIGEALIDYAHGASGWTEYQKEQDAIAREIVESAVADVANGIVDDASDSGKRAG